ncbi:DALR domain-containing protein, partial [Cronobacter sakazakii]|uniref:DALR domain-containing protein n=2 Tax=Enterobacterales TaxID=91347 RepID=UPI00349FC2B4
RSEQHDTWRARFCEAMDDDFNTPQALAVLFELTREINRLYAMNEGEAAALATTLKVLGNVLGLFEQSAAAFLTNRDDVHPAELQLIENLIHQRSEARRMGEWGKADRLRNELAEQGIELEDVGENTSWRIR